MYINHPDKTIEKKVNFFYDYYIFAVSQMGKNSDFEIDNFQSLIEKIIFQLEFNFGNCTPYILSYLTHPILNYENKYFKELKSYPEISDLLNELKIVLHEKSGNKRTLANEVCKKLKKQLTYIKKYMFKNALQSIISYLACEHDLDEHKNDIKHYTKVIAVDLYFQKKGKADIKGIFEKILSRNIEVFPFPDYLIKNNHGNKEALKSYLDNKSFREQFEAILTYLKKPAKKNYFIFRIGNIICDDNLLFKYDEVTICTRNESKIIKAIKSYNKKRETDDINFFESNFDLFAIVSQNINHEREDVKIAIEKAYNYLDHINKTCQTSGFIDRNSYLFTEDFVNFGYNISWSGTKNRLNNYSKISLMDTNPNELLGRKSIKSKRHFLSCENTYIKAKTTNSMDEYWRYIENLIQKPVKGKFVKFVEDNLVDTQITLVENYLENLLSLGRYNGKRMTLTFEKQKQLVIRMQSKNFDYNEILLHTQDEFIKDLIAYKETLASKNIENYILRILNDLYAQRNSIQHSNTIHEKTKLKLEQTVPVMFLCLRSKLLSNMILNPNREFNDIIEIATGEKKV